MSKDQALVCPICALYLHPGVALGDHLNTHSKEKVIELLWNLSNVGGNEAAGPSADGTVIETANETHNKRDFHQVDVEPPDEDGAERSTTCSFIYGTRSSDIDVYTKGCDDDDDESRRSDDSSENFENILIVIIVVAVIILYLKM